MKEEEISNVAKILDEWNPLGEAADSVNWLEGYRIEAIDIISSLRIIPGNNNVGKAIEKVLTQAFSIDLDKQLLQKASKNVAHPLGMRS